jgi:chemotaxis methyl-accepting protein methylase
MTDPISGQPDLQKFLGPQLMDAGLLTKAQVTVIYTDQEHSGLSFSEVAISRGWVKEETVSYVLRKVRLTENLMSVVKELRNDRDALQTELEALRVKQTAFLKRVSVNAAIAQPAHPGLTRGIDRTNQDDGIDIDWIG